jgi:hypothetical protein
METQETQKISRDALIDRLVKDLKPVRRIWPVNARLAMWLLLEAALLFLIVVFNSRPDLPDKIHNLRFLLEVTAFVAAGTLAAVLALRTAIPGREATKHELGLAALVSVVAILCVFSEPMSLDVTLGGFVRAGLWCAFCTASVAAIPWAAMLWAVRRGAPTAIATAGALIGMAAFFYSVAITRMGCTIDDRLHFLTWHVIPALVGVTLSVLAGIAWLRRRPVEIH